MDDIILAAVSDLFFQSQIELAAKAEGAAVQFVSRGEHLAEMVRNFKPFLLVLDLSGSDSEWIYKHIGDIKERQPDFPIVAFIPHILEAEKMRAESAGCDAVFAKSIFSKKLPQIIKKYLK